jgi:hypothetical protein
MIVLILNEIKNYLIYNHVFLCNGCANLAIYLKCLFNLLLGLF